MGAVFTRPATVNGQRYVAGAPVPEDAFNGRRLAQLVELRRVVMDDSDHAKLLVRADVVVPPPAEQEPSPAPAPVAAGASLFAPDPEVSEETEAPAADGELPFLCSVEDCDRRFSSERGRSNHEGRTHTNG